MLEFYTFLEDAFIQACVDNCHAIWNKEIEISNSSHLQRVFERELQEASIERISYVQGYSPGYTKYLLGAYYNYKPTISGNRNRLKAKFINQLTNYDSDLNNSNNPFKKKLSQIRENIKLSWDNTSESHVFEIGIDIYARIIEQHVNRLKERESGIFGESLKIESEMAMAIPAHVPSGLELQFKNPEKFPLFIAGLIKAQLINENKKWFKEKHEYATPTLKYLFESKVLITGIIVKAADLFKKEFKIDNELASLRRIDKPLNDDTEAFLETHFAFLKQP